MKPLASPLTRDELGRLRQQLGRNGRRAAAAQFLEEVQRILAAAASTRPHQRDARHVREALEALRGHCNALRAALDAIDPPTASLLDAYRAEHFVEVRL